MDRRIKEKLLLLLLFLNSMNFMNKFFYFVIFILLYYALAFKVNVQLKRINPICIILTIFSLVMSILSVIYDSADAVDIIVYISMPLYFIMGTSVFRRICITKDDCIKSFESYVLIPVIGIAVHGVLNLFYNFSRLRGSGISERVTFDFWNGLEWIATGQVSLFILISGLLYYTLFCLNLRKDAIKKIIMIALIIMGIYYNMQLATRTLVYACIIALIIIAIVLYIKEANIVSNAILNIVKFAGVIAVAYFCYQIDLFSIKTYISSSPLVMRISGFDSAMESNVRTLQNEHVLKLFLESPLSIPRFNDTVELNFVHNMILTILYQYGILPAIAIAIYELYWVIQCIRCLKINAINKRVISIIFGVNISLLCFTMVEPAYSAVPWLFSIHAYLVGLFDEMIKEVKHENNPS